MSPRCLALLPFIVAALTSCSEGGAGDACVPDANPDLEEEVTVQQALTRANKALVSEAVDQLLRDGDLTAIDRYWAETYLQHHPEVQSGVGPFRSSVRELISTPGFRFDRVRTIADGELVAIHGRYIVGEPQVAFDVFRVEAGKIVEHWGVSRPETPPNPSGRTLLDGPTEVLNVYLTAANRALVRGFTERLLVDGDTEAIPDFVGESFAQHDARASDGAAALTRALLAPRGADARFEYARVHRVIAEGNFVLTQSEGQLGGAPHAFYDLFRVHAGRVVEHWDVISKVPPLAASGLGTLERFAHAR